MAYEGELVKLGNGRWARFQRCRVHETGHARAEQTSILVAVELDDEQQVLLSTAEESIQGEWRRSTQPRAKSLTTDAEHPHPTWPGDIGALH